MSAVIYAAIVVMWAVVLVPMWLRRHDAQTESRSVDRFSTAMRTLSRRTTSGPGRRYVVMPRRSEGGVSVHVSGAAVAPAEPKPASSPSRPPARQVARSVRESARTVRRSHSRTSLVARRRRLFLVLGVVTFLTFILAVAGVMPWLLQLILDVVLFAFCFHLRAQARRAAAVSRQRRRAPHAGDGRAPAPARGAAPRPKPSYRPAASRPAAPQQAPYVEAVEAEPLVATGTDADTWEPVPVPRPTYTLKPPAPVEVPAEMIDPLRDTDPYNSMAAVREELPPPGSEVIAATDEDVETDLDDILQRRWA